MLTIRTHPETQTTHQIRIETQIHPIRIEMRTPRITVEMLIQVIIQQVQAAILPIQNVMIQIETILETWKIQKIIIKNLSALIPFLEKGIFMSFFTYRNIIYGENILFL